MTTSRPSDRHCYVCGDPDPKEGLVPIPNTSLWVCTPPTDRPAFPKPAGPTDKEKQDG